jgi:protein-L-isoaspartate(D-aspartate) O-methyltransferase
MLVLNPSASSATGTLQAWDSFSIDRTPAPKAGALVEITRSALATAARHTREAGAMTDSVAAREAMIARQLRTTRVTDERVVAAIRAIPRELFVPESRKGLAYIDEDIEVSPGRYLMEPMVFGRLLVAAQIGPAETVLVVGGATGYAGAVIAQLAGAVVSLESDAGLSARAAALYADLGLANVRAVTGDLAAGAAAEGPYDVIFFDGCIEQAPPHLLAQLAPDGRVVGVIADQGVGRGFTARVVNGHLGIDPFMDANVAPLPGFAKPKAFTF